MHRKLRHGRTVHRSQGLRGRCVSFDLAPSSSSWAIVHARSVPLSRRCSNNVASSCTPVREEKSHPRPRKYPALGGCPLDTTNRYSRFDMDLRVQPAAKRRSALPAQRTFARILRCRATSRPLVHDRTFRFISARAIHFDAVHSRPNA